MIPDIDRHQFGLRIRALLYERRVTGREVARLLKIPEQQFSRYLHGTIPDATILLKIARWGGHSVDWLLTGQDSDHHMHSAPQEGLQTKARQELDHFTEVLRLLDETTKADLLELLRYAGRGDRAKLFMQTYLHIVTDLIALEEGEAALPVRDRKAIALTQLLLTMCQAKLSVKDQERLWLEFGLALPRSKDAQSESAAEDLQKRLATLLSRLPNPRVSIARVRKILSPVRSTHLDIKQLHRIATELLSLSRHHPASQFRGISLSHPTFPHVHMFLLSRLEEATSKQHTDNEWKTFTEDILERIVGSTS